VIDDVFEQVIDEYGDSNKALASKVGELLPFPVVVLALLVQLDRRPFSPGLFPVLFPVDVEIDPPDPAAWWTLK
jgi:hypothetical protein